MASNTAENWLWGIQPESICAIGVFINFAVAISVSAVTDDPPEHI